MVPTLGVSIGPVTLLRELGRGGMGVVYLAEDHQRGDLCAVKLLHQHLTNDETAVARFQNEARAASAIQHSAIVQIRGINRLPDGQWYCMMEYLDGETLAQFCAARGPLPFPLILEIIAPLCEAIDQAHAHSIIHRDLKPDNVIVLMRDDLLLPKLLDFGIAKLVGAPSVTRPGSAPGTVAYMAPEQTRGIEVDRRCDVYSLGVIVYQLITGGRLPYDAQDGELYYRQMTQPPIDPRERYQYVLEAAVPSILSAIDVDPARRPPTAGTFALMLAQCIPDGVKIFEKRAPKLLPMVNLKETLRMPSAATTHEQAILWDYQYGDRLGKGGFGEVLRGVKLGANGFRLDVAIKRMLAEHSQKSQFIEMFQQEAHTISMLSHQNVIKVLDYRMDPFGQLIIVMEHIDGIDLYRLKQTGPIPHSVIIYIISQVLEGLGYAHHLRRIDGSSVRGIVHRDMSHDNVMISRDGGVKVMDFGIAKLREGTQATASMTFKGKPAYSAPEVAASKGFDGRSDLFSIGVMLWELLTGYSLFERENLYQTVYAVSFEDIPAPSVVNPNVPADLERVTMRLLERLPSNRYQCAQDAIEAINACSAASRNALAELKQLLAHRLRPPAAHAVAPRASQERPGAHALPTVVASPLHSARSQEASAHDRARAYANGTPANVWPQSSPTTHSQASGAMYSAASSRSGTSRALGIAAAITVLGAVAAVVVLVFKGSVSDDLDATPERSIASTGESVTPLSGAATVSGQTAVPATLAPADARPQSTIAVETEPAGAMVRLEGGEGAGISVAAARSPVVVHLPQGAQVRVSAELVGYAPASQLFTVDGTDRQTFTLTLLPIPQPVNSMQRALPSAKPGVRRERSQAKSPDPKGMDDEDALNEIIK